VPPATAPVVQEEDLAQEALRTTSSILQEVELIERTAGGAGELDPVVAAIEALSYMMFANAIITCMGNKNTQKSCLQMVGGISEIHPSWNDLDWKQWWQKSNLMTEFRTTVKALEKGSNR
jgi:hypothetical protein